MNVVNKNKIRTHRKTTVNDFQIRRLGQYNLQYKTCQLPKKMTNNTNHQSKNLIIDSSVLHSRSICRSDLMSPSSRYFGVTDGGLSAETSDIEYTQSLPAPRRTTRSDNFDIPNMEANQCIYVSEYDVNQKLEDFVVNSTPRQLIKPKSFATTPACSVSAVSAVSAVVRNKSRNLPIAKKTDSKSEITNSVVLVLTEGRGSAQGEIGLAAIDLKRPVLILCQISDTQTYMNTINKINILNPAEILVPNTFMDQMQGTILYNTIKSQFPLSAILTASRKHFSENEGKLYLKNSIIPECISTLEQVLPKFYAVSAAAALLKHIEFNHNVIFSSSTLRIEYEGVEKSMFVDKVKFLGEQLETEYLIPQNSCKRGFHVQVELKNIKNFNVKHPPSICKNVECVKNIVKFTTEDLLVLNVRITQALNEVEILTNAILNEMLKELRKYISCIYDLCNGIADLDLIFSFAQYSMRSGLTRPKFGQYMDIKSSRHPILDIINSVVPVDNDIFASTDRNLNIITGPNMGGKSIYIRQVALLQIIAQIGCFVPATFAQFRICDRLFTRIGFGDSIESNASTWVLEIKELNGIIPSLTKHSLVIIDELCRATSCEEGSTLAWAICEHIMQSCAFIFFATHNTLITKLQDLYCNVLNYHMEALPARDSSNGLTYTYKLRPGATNIDDYGLTLARDVKMPEYLIEHATEIEKCLRQTRTALPDNPSNEADLILDNCIQKLLSMKDTERLNISNFQSVVLEMMNKLKENRRKNIDPLMECIDSEEEMYTQRLSDYNTLPTNNST